MTNKFEVALKFATNKHSGQYRKGGEDYITHPIAVATMLKDAGFSEDYQIAGLFHDLLEDTNATPFEIENLSSKQVITAVLLMTKNKGYNMQDYISNIKSNKIAFTVKGFDRLHNLKSAVYCDESFKLKYALETIEWYLDFSPLIKAELKNLIETMQPETLKLLNDAHP